MGAGHTASFSWVPQVTGRWAARGCLLEKKDEADYKEEQNNDDFQKEGSQNSVLIVGVGMRVWPGLHSHQP